MANQPQVYDLFVTCVDKVGPLLKIWGQIDRQTSVVIEQLLLDKLKQFEQQNHVVPITSLQPGLLCCAKYKDGIYYRAQIRNLKTPIAGTVEVRFVDYGNIEFIELKNIRLFDDNNLKLIKPQASEFILASVIHSANVWDDAAIAFVHHEIAYTELKTIIIGMTAQFKLVKIMLNENVDLASYLVSNGLVTPISPQAQEIILRNIMTVPLNPQMQNRNVPTRSPPQNPELFTYKPELLPPNSEHMVYVSYVEDGPYLFSIQLQSMEEVLEQLMQEINGIQLQHFTAPPLPGNPCLARCIEDNTICRAVVLNLVGDKCKTYYVDFGNTDILEFSNIYQIPYNCLLPKVMSMRFTLSGLKNINVTNEMKCAFKEYVTNKLLKLKVLKLDDSPLIQYCELFDENNKNILEVLYEISGEFKSLTMSKGAKHDVIVSYIEGCKKFFVQLKECTVSLNNLMLALASTSEMSPNLSTQEIKQNQACCAFYSGDNQWYRAKITSLQNDLATVKYVDYGNEDVVAPSQLKRLNPQFINILPAQAIECCLLGYQNMSFNTEIENAFESLTLECEFTMRVMGKLNHVLLVDLFDAEGNNVAALLIERLAAQKSQILPAQQVANSLLNNTSEQQIKTFSPKESPKENWRSPENKTWKNSSEEKSNWREEKSSWRENKGAERTNERNRSQTVKHENNKSKGKNNQKKKRDKPQWTEDTGAKGDSWDTKPQFKKRDFNSDRPRSRGEKSDSSFGEENKKSYSRNEFQRKPRDNFSERRPQEKWGEKKDKNSWGDDKKQDNWGENKSDNRQKDNWNDRKPRNFDDRKKDWGDKPKFNKRDDFNENSSEKSWKSKNSQEDNYKSKGGKSFSPKKDYSSPKKEIPKVIQPVSELSEPFKPLEVIIGSNESVAISWFYTPQNFFCQFLSKQKEFRDMMIEIQNAYTNPSKIPISSDIPIGSSVIAEFSEDSILYRATILEKKGFKYKVQYVDFGNIGLVDSKKIWQVETRFMELPIQCVRCGVAKINPVEENWPVSKDVDEIFNKESFLCVFDNIVDDKYEIQLWDGDVNVKEKLVELGIAKDGDVFTMDGDPIDINLLLGQNLKITLSHIISLQTFFVQLDKYKMNEINNAINAFNFDILQPLSAEAIINEMSCLVKLDGGKWCRGVIIDNSNVEAISINCPDVGNKIEVAATNIYPLPSELCIYWYQAIECTLHNLTNDSCLLLSDEKFKEDFENKEVIAYIDDVDIGRLIVTLYDTNGKKLDLFDPDEDAFPTVNEICPLPVFSNILTIYVTHINNSDSVFGQKASDSTKISELLEKLFEFYENGGEAANYEKDSLCCAKSSDGNWYRAKMTNLIDEQLEVVFIDYGNEEIISKECVKILDKQFYEHELALNFGLNLIETSPDFKDKFNELTNEKELKAVLYFGESSWLAELYDGETNLNKILTDLNLATIKTEPILQICPPKIESENRASVTVTHVDSPTEFYVQLNANENDITMLQCDLQEKADLLPNLEVAEIGSLCAAKYAIDEQWYRAEVLDADNDITTVRFVDFGNTDVIDNNSESLKTLPSELLSIDKYAKKCALNIISSKEDWTQEACELFENAINVENLYADIVYQDEKTKTYVELYDGEKNIAQLLIDGGLAERVERNFEDEIASNSGFVSHFNSISEFWIQLESSIPDLEMIVERLSAVNEFPDLQDLSLGMLCAANYPEDEMWYRARILSNTVAGVEVIFIDYGNSSMALKLKVLPEELVHMPALALKCSLNKPPGISEWSETANEKFKEISSDGATVFTVKKLAPGETSIVDLFIGEENVVDQLILKENVKAELVKCYINYFASPEKIYVIKVEDSNKLDDVMAQVSAAEDYEKLKECSIGVICATIYEECWYRAQILSEEEVCLLDYGNVIKLNDLRVLPEELKQIPPLSTICSLENKEWSSEAKKIFDNIHGDGSQEYDIEFLNSDNPATIRIYLEGVDLSESLIDGKDSKVIESNVEVKNEEEIEKKIETEELQSSELEKTDVLDENIEDLNIEEPIEEVPNENYIENEVDNVIEEGQKEIEDKKDISDENPDDIDAKQKENFENKIVEENNDFEEKVNISDENIKDPDDIDAKQKENIENKTVEEKIDIGEKINISDENIKDHDDIDAQQKDNFENTIDEKNNDIEEKITILDENIKGLDLQDGEKEDVNIKSDEEINKKPNKNENKESSNLENTDIIDEINGLDLKDAKEVTNLDNITNNLETQTNSDFLPETNNEVVLEKNIEIVKQSLLTKKSLETQDLKNHKNADVEILNQDDNNSEPICSKLKVNLKHNALTSSKSENCLYDLLKENNFENNLKLKNKSDPNLIDFKIENTLEITSNEQTEDKFILNTDSTDGRLINDNISTTESFSEVDFCKIESKFNINEDSMPSFISVTVMDTEKDISLENSNITPKKSYSKSDLTPIKLFDKENENFNRVTPKSEKIVPGCISRGILYENDSNDQEISISYPITPKSEKIVPGSISRGDISELYDDEQISLETEKGNIEYSFTLNGDKKVPDSISSEDVSEIDEDYLKNKKFRLGIETDNILTSKVDNITEINVYKTTPKSEKIVPGSISRGISFEEFDLELPTEKNINIEVLDQTDNDSLVDNKKDSLNNNLKS